MNILPKKSWHVRNKDNVAKVRKDEEEARLQEKDRLRRVALAEQESRTELLRKRARGLSNTTDTQLARSEPGTTTNLFKNLETDAKNAEHEEEKRLEKEAQEKKIGLLTYLGQSAVETMKDDDKPWYFKAPQRTADESKDSKRKASLDPLNDMKEHLSKKKKKSKKSHKKEKTHSHERRTSSGAGKDDKMMQMRKARLQREAQERQRAKGLLEKHYGVAKANDDSPPRQSTFVPKYNNQFNPLFARNNRTSK
uniref:Leukocyte receptor cluster member 1 homolog n=1 Tax=Phallusia mammillata TaxID=59560 RepID=A0A6F9DKI3_9ASCI|nr:leukocyte receptor cluster member 1 homolog [Phallusia mammillata]